MSRNRAAFASGWTVAARTAPTLLIALMALSGVRPSPLAWLWLAVATVTYAVSKVASPPLTRVATGLEAN